MYLYHVSYVGTDNWRYFFGSTFITMDHEISNSDDLNYIYKVINKKFKNNEDYVILGISLVSSSFKE